MMQMEFPPQVATRLVVLVASLGSGSNTTCEVILILATSFSYTRNLRSHLPDLGLNIGWIVVLTVASDEMDRIVVEASHVFTFMLFTGIFRTFTLRPLFIRHFEIFYQTRTRTPAVSVSS